MGWEQAKEVAEKSRGGGSYIKLENDGDKIVCAFLGEPFAKEIHWTGDTSELCEGEDCKHCRKGKNPSARFSINVYVKTLMTKTKKGYDEEEIEEVRIFEQGIYFFNDLVTVDEKYSFGKYWFEIERQGKAKSTRTRYKINVLPEDKITKAEKEMLGEVELFNLENPRGNDDDDDDDDDDDKTERKSSSKNDRKPSKSSKDDVIDTEDSQNIVTRLKMRPREELNEFMKEFNIKRIKDLKQSQLKQVLAYLDKLEGSEEKDSEDDDEVDPFA